ncbi:MAG: hypothetical protein U9O94_03270 [Nanoarchaeota archaeon]|nr:hypothetical protein [Nanoarchaeota archaeon]
MLPPLIANDKKYNIDSEQTPVIPQTPAMPPQQSGAPAMPQAPVGAPAMPQAPVGAPAMPPQMGEADQQIANMMSVGMPEGAPAMPPGGLISQIEQPQPAAPQEPKAQTSNVQSFLKTMDNLIKSGNLVG